MPRRSDPRNPLVINSGNEFSEVGYLTGGTPMPVNVVAGGAGGGLTQTQVRDSTAAWADVGYLAGGGTPLPVNLVAGVLTGANPSDGTLSSLGTLKIAGTVGTVGYVTNIGTLYALDHGTIAISGGTLTGSNPSAGTLDIITQIGTLPVLGTVGTLSYLSNVGTVYYVAGIGNGTIQVSGGTLTGANPSAGTLDTLTQIGTLPTLGTLGTLYYLNGFGMGTVRVEYGTISIDAGTVKLSVNSGVDIGDVDVASGTLGISAGTLQTVTQLGTLPTLGTMGTLYYLSGLGQGTLNIVTQIGTLPTQGTMGTLFYLNNLGTVYNVAGVSDGTIGIGSGTLQTVTQIGTLPTVGTLGTLYYLSGLGMGTVRVDSGTVSLSGGTISQLPTLGTLGTMYYLNNVGTLYGLSSGTLNSAGTCWVGNGTVQVGAGTVTLGGLGTVRVDLGTIKISDGTLGTVNVYTKHDLHVYDNAGTFFVAAVAGGTVVVGVASKCIKVHYYSVETDGTFLAMFMDGAIDRGTLGPMWTFTQREGAIAPFVPYPAYLFKTTAGTPLFIGTKSSLNNFACAGTLNVHVVYTDDDTS